MLQQITKENPSFPVGKTKAKIFKDGMMDWGQNNKPNSFRVSASNVEEIKAYTRQRLDKMIQTVNKASEIAAQGNMVDKSTEEYDNLVDSDSDCYLTPHVFKVGENVDIQISSGRTSSWHKGKVQMSLEEML